MLNLKGAKVACFHTLVEVLILKTVSSLPFAAYRQRENQGRDADERRFSTEAEAMEIVKEQREGGPAVFLRRAQCAVDFEFI